MLNFILYLHLNGKCQMNSYVIFNNLLASFCNQCSVGNLNIVQNFIMESLYSMVL